MRDELSRLQPQLAINTNPIVTATLANGVISAMTSVT